MRSYHAETQRKTIYPLLGETLCASGLALGFGLDVGDAVGVCGVEFDVAALVLAVDFSGCKNEAEIGGVEGALYGEVAIAGVDGFGHLSVERVAAQLLGGAEIGKSFCEPALETAFVELDIAERLFVFGAGLGFDHGGAFGGIFDFGDGFGEVFEMREGEDVGLISAGAFDAPLGIADGLREHLLDGAFRGEFGEEFGAEGFVGCRVFTGEEHELTG